MQAQTKDPVLAVMLHEQNAHAKQLIDHETRLRPLEAFRAQVLALSFIGAAVGAALINFIFNRLGAR